MGSQPYPYRVGQELQYPLRNPLKSYRRAPTTMPEGLDLQYGTVERINYRGRMGLLLRNGILGLTLSYLAKSIS